MKPHAELNHLNLDPATKTQVAAMVHRLIEQARQEAIQQEQQAFAAQLQAKDAEIKQKEIKIQAITHELLYLRRIRYGVKNEALNQVQRDLFEETWNTDLAAVEAELEQLQNSEPQPTVAKPKRPRAGRKMLLHFLHSPHPCGLSSATTRSSATH